jgi:hypothetical protein
MNANYVIEPEPVFEPDKDQIARDAYGLYCERGRVDGFDREDWLEAEQRLKLAHFHMAPVPRNAALPSPRTRKMSPTDAAR